MTKVIRIPVTDYIDRVTIIKQLRTELGPMGTTWWFVSGSKTFDITVKDPLNNSAILTFLVLKYGQTILS